MNIIASLIIPTHNRSASLKKMLQTLQLQSIPLQNFEVIIVADGCHDDTAEVVKNYKAGFSLSLYELPGLGAASARNKGASMARGKFLIFADDDMAPSDDFIEQHLASHKNENTVVIGYSPFKLESEAGIQRMGLREWWEEKFQEMRKKDHRFRYDDLTSGNFSIASDLFQKVNGFDTTLLCREDYELGFRLIKEGAEFHFAYAAKAFHRDEVTNLQRSFQRKKSEGIADIQIKKKHPDFSNREALFYLSHRSFAKSLLLKAVQQAPDLSEIVANLGGVMMNYFEKFKMRTSWLRMNYRLHQYWYLRGLMQEAQNARKLRQLIKDKEVHLSEHQKLSIDLKQGLEKVEKELDCSTPLTIDIYYATKFIGSVNYQAGAEPIKGVHLRRIVKDTFSNELFEALLPETILTKS